MTQKPNKYIRMINAVDDFNGFTSVDVYSVLEAFAVKCPATQHAIKKLLCAGIRGQKTTVQDLEESRDSITRAIQMEMQRNANNENSEGQPWKDPLNRQPICNSHHNPHEVIVARCHKCFTIHSDSRERLQEMGWRLFVELRIEDHEGFEVCPHCADRCEYCWEDLY